MHKLIIAEDNMVSAMELEEYLSARGRWVVGLATSGTEALDMARSISPDLLLIEIMVPGEMDGVSIAQEIKAEIDIPVVFLVGDTDQALIERAKQISSYSCIRKPFQTELVEAVIEAALQREKRTGNNQRVEPRE